MRGKLLSEGRRKGRDARRASNSCEKGPILKFGEMLLPLRVRGPEALMSIELLASNVALVASSAILLVLRRNCFMTPEETATRKVEPTAEGVRVELRAPTSAVFFKTLQQLVIVLLGAYLLRAVLASLENWSPGGSLFWPFSLLESWNLSPGTTRWILYAALVLTGYSVIGGVIDILMRLTRRDHILIQPGQWLVERRVFGIARRSVIELHESVALEFDSFDSALLARTPTRKVTITNLGTADDRQWLKSQLDKKGTVSSLQNIATGGSRVIRTIKLERKSDGSLFVADSKASRYGCAIILTVLVIGLVVAGARYGGGGWWAAAFFFGIVVTLLWLSSNDRNEATVNRGSIRLLSVAFLKGMGGAGIRTEKTIRSSILFVDTRGPDTLDIRTVEYESGYPSEVTLATITGTNGHADAETILKSISEVSGFPILSVSEAEEWMAEKQEAFEAGEDDGDDKETDENQGEA